MLALLAGGRTGEGRRLRDWMLRHDPSWLGAVAADAALMRLSEVDPIHRASAVTASAMTLPLALAHARTDPTSSATDLMHAMVIGQELAIRLALALGGAALLAHGVWPSYVVAPVAAAATTGRLRGLSPHQMDEAATSFARSLREQQGVLEVFRFRTHDIYVPLTWVGANTGRWRVRAVNAQATNPWTSWRYFRFSR